MTARRGGRHPVCSATVTATTRPAPRTSTTGPPFEVTCATGARPATFAISCRARIGAWAASPTR